MTEERANEKAAPGWFPDPDDDQTLRFWDGKAWTEQRAPVPAQDGQAAMAVWALSLACGVAGAVAWDAPVVAYYWPLGLGAAGIASALVARRMSSSTPWWAIVAVITSVIAVILGVEGHNQIEDVRSQLEGF